MSGGKPIQFEVLDHLSFPHKKWVRLLHFSTIELSEQYINYATPYGQRGALMP